MVLVCVGALVCFPQPQGFWGRVLSCHEVQVSWGSRLSEAPRAANPRQAIHVPTFTDMFTASTIILIVHHRVSSDWLASLRSIQDKSALCLPQKTVHSPSDDAYVIAGGKKITLAAQLPTLSFFNYLSLVVGCDWVDIKSFSPACTPQKPINAVFLHH